MKLFGEKIFGDKIIIYPERGEVSRFVKTAYVLVAKHMKVPIQKFPHILYFDPDKVEKKVKEAIRKMINISFSLPPPLIPEEKIEDIIEICKRKQTEGVFTSFKREDKYLTFILINKKNNDVKDLGFVLGEEIFHFVYRHHSKTLRQKRAEDADYVSEFFGKIGSFLLYHLFRKFNKSGLNFFKGKKSARTQKEIPQREVAEGMLMLAPFLIGNVSSKSKKELEELKDAFFKKLKRALLERKDFDQFLEEWGVQISEPNLKQILGNKPKLKMLGNELTRKECLEKLYGRAGKSPRWELDRLSKQESAQSGAQLFNLAHEKGYTMADKYIVAYPSLDWQ